MAGLLLVALSVEAPPAGKHALFAGRKRLEAAIQPHA